MTQSPRVSAKLLHVLEPIVKLPEDWINQSRELASFRYRVPKGKASDPADEVYVKLLQIAPSKIEVNALSNLRNDEILSCEFEYNL